MKTFFKLSLPAAMPSLAAAGVTSTRITLSIGLLCVLVAVSTVTAAPFEIEGVIKQVRTIETKPPYTFDGKEVISIYLVGHRYGKDFDYQYMVVKDTTELEGISFSDLEAGKYVRVKGRGEPPGMVGKPIQEVRASRYGVCNFALHVDTFRTPQNISASVTDVQSFGPKDIVVTVREDKPGASEFKYLIAEGKTTFTNGGFSDIKVSAKIDISGAGINVPVPQDTDHGKLHGADLFAATVTLLKGPYIMTVAGPIEAASAGMALAHEHVLVDFIGADQAGPGRYDSGKVFDQVRPHLARVHELGARMFVECTPAFLGRDARLLQRLGEATDLHILTNTGLYGARNGKFLPPYVAVETAEQLAARWIAEARDGIDGTGIRPGFVKCGVNADAKLSDVDRKLVEAAALTHRATGLIIAVHTGAGPGLTQIEILKAHGVAPSAWIWVHAQNARDADILAAAQQGAWVSFDGLRPETMKRHLELCHLLRDKGWLNQVLISHDAGWYDPAKPDGGAFRDFQFLFTHFIPSLKKAGFTTAQISQLMCENPARAFAVGLRLLDKPGFGQSIQFNLKDAPFSYPKSGLSVCDNGKTNGVAATDIRYSSFGSDNVIVKFQFIIQGKTITPNAIAAPGEMCLQVDGKTTARACFENYKLFRLKGQTHPLVLMPDIKLIDNKRVSITQKTDNIIHIQNNNNHGVSCHVISCIHGALQYSEDTHLLVINPSNDNSYEICIEETDSTWASSGALKNYNACVTEARDSYQTFLSKMPTLPEKYAEARKFASYILWSSEIDYGDYKRPGMLMSKNWMHYIWSWDHCFNAMACAENLPNVAWDNFILLFDAQNEKGQIPDRHGYAPGSTHFRNLKPPIHGWALKKIMAKNELGHERTEQAYKALKNWTNFWLKYRDTNNNGMPEYNHGNDTGWDNGTEFDIVGKSHQSAGRESASLPAFLVLQMDVLHDLALKLGLNEEAAAWKQQSEKLLALMISNNWNGKKFVTINIQDNSINEKSQSLMQFLPIVLGDKLPGDIRATLISGLKNEGFLTQWGLATENLNSPLYETDGYWRGPIWAPSTMIIVDGLARAGEKELAVEIARRFCDLCAKSGFAENFDPKTGKGLRDLAYTWTASVFLVLGHEYLMKIE